MDSRIVFSRSKYIPRRTFGCKKSKYFSQTQKLTLPKLENSLKYPCKNLTKNYLFMVNLLPGLVKNI